MAVLPPTDESTCDRSVVGTWMKLHPRFMIDAASRRDRRSRPRQARSRDPCAPPPMRAAGRPVGRGASSRSEEHTSELQSLMRISYAVFCLQKKSASYCHMSRANTTARTSIKHQTINSTHSLYTITKQNNTTTAI